MRITPEIRRKMSISHLGKKQSEETRLKRSLALKGKFKSKKHRKKLSESHTGVKLSLEHCKRISEGNQGKHRERLLKIITGKKCSKETKKKIGIKIKEDWQKYSKDLKNKRLNNLKEARKNLIFPIKDTSIEVKIQNFLKQLSIEFFTHQYIKEIEHGYQCDIFIPSMNLVIECDGDYWHKYPIGRNIDKIRTSELLEKGFKVLRLWEYEIKEMDLNKFKEKL